MPVQKVNPIGNDWVPPAQSFGNSPEPVALVVADNPLQGWNQDTPAQLASWSFTSVGYTATFTQG